MSDLNSKKKKNKGGRPQIILTDKQIAEVEELSAYLNCEQIADYFGISRTAFFEILRRDGEVSALYKKGKAHKIYRYGKILEEKAIGLNPDGDTTSIIFYLKTQGRWTTEYKNDNNPNMSLCNKDSHEIINSALTAFAEGKISIAEAQQMSNLAITKMNIDNNKPLESHAEVKQKTREERLEIAEKLNEAIKNLQYCKDNNITLKITGNGNK